MRAVLVAFSLALFAPYAMATLWAGPPDHHAWFATNENGFCVLKRVATSGDLKLEFTFVSGLVHSSVPEAVTFQVMATPAKLGWPMRLLVGSDPAQPPFVLGGDPAAPIRLEGAEAQRLLAFLKAGRGLDVAYVLVDGGEMRLYLDAYKFPQAAAMFEACNAHVA